MKNFLKGIIVGLGGVAPGLSGSVLLIIFGLYQQVLEALGTLFKDFKKKIQFLLPVVSGMFAGVLLFCMCGVIRLAFFNVLELKRQETEDGCNKTYRGLPITSSSFIFPITYCFYFFVTEEMFAMILHVLLCVVAFLFVLDFTVPKYDFKKVLVKVGLLHD